jgi:hypothetical protein
MENLKNIELNTNMSFEPRLQEYLKKLSNYKKYNIEPNISLEKEFNITLEDKNTIKIFFTNIKNKEYNNNTNNFNNYSDLNSNTTFSIKDDDFKKDPRYLRLQQKIQRDKNAINNKYSYGGINSVNNTPNISNDCYMLNKEQPILLDSEPQYNDINLNIRTNVNQNNFVSKPPKIKYNQRLYNNKNNMLDHHHNIDNLINKLDKFKNHTNTIYKDKEDNLIGGTRDIDIENCLIKGIPERNAKAKSIGYPNYSDHAFQFISDDIQDPKHVILPFSRGGINSRSHNNFKIAKSYHREIYQ